MTQCEASSEATHGPRRAREPAHRLGRARWRTVETVTGPIDADQLGTTLIHEHLIYRDEAVALWWPHVGSVVPVDRPEPAAPAELHEAAVRERAGRRRAGWEDDLRADRDVRRARRRVLDAGVSDETGLQVVPCTGIYTYDYLPLFFVARDADAMADLFVHDIEQGIQGTEIKAAFLKCAADEPGVTENIEKVHRAVARASVRTGAPIMAHSRPASQTGPGRSRSSRRRASTCRRSRSRTPATPTTSTTSSGLLDKGVYIGLDRYGLEIFLPIEKRNADRDRAARAGLRRPHVPLPGLLRDARLVPGRGREQLLAGRRREGLEHDPGLRGGDPRPARGAG